MRVEDGEFVHVTVSDRDEQVVVEYEREWTFAINNGVAELVEVDDDGSPVYVETIPMWLEALLGRLGIEDCEA